MSNIRRNASRLVLLIVSIISGGLVLMALIAPSLQHFWGYPHGEEVYGLLSPICHQFPTRSFWVFARPMGLCARCVSGYLGLFVAATWLRLSISYSKRFVVGALLLATTLVDPFVQLNTAYVSTNFVRLLSGLAGGIAVALIFLPVSLHSKE